MRTYKTLSLIVSHKITPHDCLFVLRGKEGSWGKGRTVYRSAAAAFYGGVKREGKSGRGSEGKAIFDSCGLKNSHAAVGVIRPR